MEVWSQCECDIFVKKRLDMYCKTLSIENVLNREKPSLFNFGVWQWIDHNNTCSTQKKYIDSF